jgi:hypothetical protein
VKLPTLQRTDAAQVLDDDERLLDGGSSGSPDSPFPVGLARLVPPVSPGCGFRSG